MAIRIKLEKTERILFCSSKWWGDPDMPADMQYPMFGDYPLTFICQINCEDIAPFDKEGRLPHEGMLYFFGAIDEYLGYETPYHCGLGEWEKGSVVVKYAKTVNFETFNSFIMVDEDENPITEEALGMSFEECPDTEDGLKLLGLPFFEEVRDACPDHLNLLQIDEDETAGTRFYDSGMLNFVIKESDLGFGNFKRTKGFLHSL